ncbi:hypothetical protein PENTCL1PPCAC_11224 [Pristionchus entomophagus]|uniref:TM2 domain-containing protein n=1 Tax=Pristionchus entomophagus TaxID=358040 RepID=A0AAV5T8W9_9BILA|nr:hypothetical protein PENTCL1PPCAC_11224 [Pristionchus entomophagus]
MQMIPILLFHWLVEVSLAAYAVSDLPTFAKESVYFSQRDIDFDPRVDNPLMREMIMNLPSDVDRPGIAQYPLGPMVSCSNIPDDFLRCESIPKHTVPLNETGCPHFGGTKPSEIAWTNVSCRVLGSIECSGSRTFSRERPCVKYTGHYFLSTLLYSLFLGILAVDRFCLGYSAIGVGKLMTLGGLGVWWLIDIFLLATGNLMPADNSNWEPYY